ncbi:DUF6886 family protein [Brevibacillus choshinensis]|uniref:DUF6886 family protein n=1 Tax=Brevibacillus choshinensis TaxID=54911 RepID=UPI002E1A1339|nr:DUF6886 family protein [Brevibacillus choshinensis]MED4750260.1 hypothetical protein [Brevibacillus choshinensis]
MSLLFHFSENPTIQSFLPRLHPSHPTLAPTVWAIDEEHAPMYYLPRDCPRIAYYPREESSSEDIEGYLKQTRANKVIAIESSWYQVLRDTVLYRYTFEPGPFTCWDKGAGYYIAYSPVAPLDVQPMGDLLEKLMESDVELRITPSLTPLRDYLVSTTLHYSMIRMRNAKP